MISKDMTVNVPSRFILVSETINRNPQKREANMNSVFATLQMLTKNAAIQIAFEENLMQTKKDTAEFQGQVTGKLINLIMWTNIIFALFSRVRSVTV